MAAQELRSRERPTVLHVSQPADGGVARVVADLVRAQVAAGLRTVVAAPPGGALGNVEQTGPITGPQL
ncbi:hypothetical protein ABT180_28660, partial [Streptomyces sp. NPDC001657]